MQELLSNNQVADYAAREAQASHLTNFAGGDLGGALIFIILIAGIAALVYLILEKNR